MIHRIADLQEGNVGVVKAGLGLVPVLVRVAVLAVHLVIRSYQREFK